jgi:hypothetical protein
MKERDGLLRCMIEARDVRSLVVIAGIATESQIFGHRRTLMLLSDDMIDLKRKPIKLLRHLAVFAAGIRSLPDKPFESFFIEL